MKYDDQCVGDIQVEILCGNVRNLADELRQSDSVLVQVNQMVAMTAASDTVVTTS